MPRGGRRQKAPGSPAKGNRLDLNQGAAAAPRAPRVRPGFGGTEGLQANPQAERPVPGAGGAFTRPTERPNEPLTAGMPTGPGPGPEVLPSHASTAADELRALFLQFPLPELRELIELADEEGR